MISIYKKVDKNKTNLLGTVKIKKLKELDKPFLLCLSSLNNYDKSIFGMIREGAQAARLYTTVDDAARYILDSFPVDFIGMRFVKDDHYSENYLEFAEKFLYPFLFINGNDPDKILKQARKINLLTFCDGALTYKNAEIHLKDLLLKKGFSKSLVLKILSQISFVAIGTVVDIADIKATGVVFVDTNDEKTTNGFSKTYKAMLDDSKSKIMFSPIKNSNTIMCTYNGSGKHSIKEYFLDECIIKPAFCAIVSNNIENSIYNRNNDSFVSIEIDKNLELLKKYTFDDKVSVLLKQLDQSLVYDNAPKYTKDEAFLKRRLDCAYKTLAKEKLLEKNKDRKIRIQENRIKALVKGIKKYSSDVAFYQILSSAHMWSPSFSEYFDYECDKLVRKKYDEILGASNQDASTSNYMFELNKDGIEEEKKRKKDN